jgi:predicted nuclease of restriction endonuclease-like (RecB) superfamily
MCRRTSPATSGGRAITNFDATMEPVRAAAAADLFKDPYVLDFVEIAEDAHERHLERALTERIKDLLLELGKGFSFMGSQYHLDVAGQDTHPWRQCPERGFAERSAIPDLEIHFA